MKRVAHDRRVFEGETPCLGDSLLAVGDIGQPPSNRVKRIRVPDQQDVNDYVQDLVREAAGRDPNGSPQRVALYFAPIRQTSPVLLSMSHIFEKFEPDKYWYGLYLLMVRLLETSMLVFFKKRTTKAMVATAVSVISLTIAQKCRPWLRDSDDQVRSIARTQPTIHSVISLRPITGC